MLEQGPVGVTALGTSPGWADLEWRPGRAELRFARKHGMNPNAVLYALRELARVACGLIDWPKAWRAWVLRHAHTAISRNPLRPPSVDAHGDTSVENTSAGQERIRAKRDAAARARRMARELAEPDDRQRLLAIADELDAEADALERAPPDPPPPQVTQAQVQVQNQQATPATSDGPEQPKDKK